MAGWAAQVKNQQLLAALESLSDDRKARAWRKKSLRAGSTIILKSAKTKAPTRTGAYKKALDRKFGRKGTYVLIGPRTDFVAHAAGDKYIYLRGRDRRKLIAANLKGNIRPSRYAHLIEKGTAAHMISNWLGARGVAVRHPGARPHPVLKPAFDENVNAALNAIGSKLWEGIKDTAMRKAIA